MPAPCIGVKLGVGVALAETAGVAAVAATLGVGDVDCVGDGVGDIVTTMMSALDGPLATTAAGDASLSR